MSRRIATRSVNGRTVPAYQNAPARIYDEGMVQWKAGLETRASQSDLPSTANVVLRLFGGAGLVVAGFVLIAAVGVVL